MKNSSKRSFAIKLASLVALCMLAMGMRSFAGLDWYEIYLNDRLIVKRAANQPLSTESFAFGKLNPNDQLVINYFQCHADDGMGKGRSILVKDSRGIVIREWKFADGNKSMVIPVKELLELAKASQEMPLSLHYAAKESTGQKLLLFNLGEKATGFRKEKGMEYGGYLAAGLLFAALTGLYIRRR